MSEIKEYINKYIDIGNEVLHSLAIEQNTRRDVQPNIGIDVGRLLSLFVIQMNAKKVIEFGSCLGYSTICLGLALQKTGGKLISVEYNEKLYQEAKNNIQKAGVSDVVEIIHGDAKEVIKNVNGPFDIILQDSAKDLYIEMLEDCIKQTRTKGLIIADDALFKPLGIPKVFSDPVHKYVDKVFNDSRLFSTLLPIGDGLLVSTKL